MKLTHLFFTAVLFLVFQGCTSRCSSVKEESSKCRSEFEKYLLKNKNIRTISTELFLVKADSALNAERNAENYYLKARAMELAGDDKSALLYSDTAIVLCNNNPELLSRVHSLRGLIHLQRGDSEKEPAEYQIVLSIGLADFVNESKEAIARSYFHNGKYAEALAALPDSLSPEGEMYYKLIRDSLEAVGSAQ